MKFEFDPAKSKANAAKHGIDFSAAPELWADAQRLEVAVAYPAEPRWLLVARLAGQTWTAVFTRRGENIRIISVRRARDHEQEQYEQNQEEDNGRGV
jgi:hypothetical protein